MKARLGVSVLAIAAVAFASGWHFGLFEAPRSLGGAAGQASETAPAPTAPAARSAAASANGTAPSDQAKNAPSPSAADAKPADVEAAQPSFDVVRVEPDGAAVVAGRAAPNSLVTLQSGTERLAEARTDATGAFALDLTLPIGQHRLALSDTARTTSSGAGETAIVNVPGKGREGDLLVMVERPGEASEILVKPAAPLAPVAEDAPATPASEPKAVAAASTKPAGTLSVEAVEAEDGKLFVAGAASERSKIRIYLDDAFVAETKGGEGDRFIASALAGVGVGDHVVRADEVDAAGQVVARVEVPFNRPDTAPLAAIAPPAAEQAAAVEGRAPDTTTSAAQTADASDTTMQPALERVGSRVIIRKGDTLWRISRNTYGFGSRFTVIYLANGDQIRNPDRIYPGQVFRLPEKEG